MSPVPSTSRRRAAIVTFIAVLALALPVGVLASHQFADVPNSNIYHNDVDALVDAGVTGGCGGGNYCPTRSVTRGEMAAFMNRLGALGPGKTPVVNATTVDGRSANELTRTARAVGSSTYTNLTTSFVSMASVSIETPSSGFVVVNASATLVSAPGSTCPCTALVRLRNVNNGTVSENQLGRVEATLAYSFIGNSYVFPVNAAGAWSFSFDAAQYALPGGTGPFGPFDVTLDATYVPFGSGGGSTLGSVDAPEHTGDTLGLPADE